MHLREALHDRPEWQPRYRCGPRVEIGTKMGCYHTGELIPKRGDTNNILHPRYIGAGIAPANTFHAALQNRVGTRIRSVEDWCTENAWFASSPTCDFRVNEAPKYRWGLPALVPTRPKKLFAQGPRLKYVDIVTDTLHAS